jgi:hypothetical protein
VQLGVADSNPQTGEDCESKKNPEGYVGPLFATSDLHSVPAGLCDWYWRTQGMFSLNLGLVTSRNDRSNASGFRLALDRSRVFLSRQSLPTLVVLLPPPPKKQTQ